MNGQPKPGFYFVVLLVILSLVGYGLYRLKTPTTDGTPPVSCGLLAGTYRALLIEQGRITEQVVTLADLKSAVSISVINSVRGIRPAVLCAALAPTSPLT